MLHHNGWFILEFPSILQLSYISNSSSLDFVIIQFPSQISPWLHSLSGELWTRTGVQYTHFRVHHFVWSSPIFQDVSPLIWYLSATLIFNLLPSFGRQVNSGGEELKEFCQGSLKAWTSFDPLACQHHQFFSNTAAWSLISNTSIWYLELDLRFKQAHLRLM